MEDDERNNEHWLLRSAQQGQEISAPTATLRDQFAMAALTGLLADTAPPATKDPFKEYAEAAYEYADAMLAAREAK